MNETRFTSLGDMASVKEVSREEVDLSIVGSRSVTVRVASEADVYESSTLTESSSSGITSTPSPSIGDTESELLYQK